MIRFIVEIFTKPRNRNGNVYISTRITSTKTSRQVFVNACHQSEYEGAIADTRAAFGYGNFYIVARPVKARAFNEFYKTCANGVEITDFRESGSAMLKELETEAK